MKDTFGMRIEDALKWKNVRLQHVRLMKSTVSVELIVNERVDHQLLAPDLLKTAIQDASVNPVMFEALMEVNVFPRRNVQQVKLMIQNKIFY